MSPRREYLQQQAEFRLVEAVANFETVDPMSSAWAAVYLTMICKINDNPVGAGRWALRAYRAAVNGVQQQCALIKGTVPFHWCSITQKSEPYQAWRTSICSVLMFCVSIS